MLSVSHCFRHRLRDEKKKFRCWSVAYSLWYFARSASVTLECREGNGLRNSRLEVVGLRDLVPALELPRQILQPSSFLSFPFLNEIPSKKNQLPLLFTFTCSHYPTITLEIAIFYSIYRAPRGKKKSRNF